MKLEKETMTKEEWILRISDRFAIPVREFVLVLVVCALFADAYNAGANFSQNVVMYSAYMTDYGIYDQATGFYRKCWPIADGNVLRYECEESRAADLNLSEDPFASYTSGT